MPENYDHYITKNIKALYKRRLFSPIVYLILVIILWHVFSLTDLLFPVRLTDDVPLESAYRNDAANMQTTLTDLKFTGYTRNNFAGTSGYYYYTIRNDECIIVQLEYIVHGTISAFAFVAKSERPAFASLKSSVLLLVPSGNITRA